VAEGGETRSCARLISRDGSGGAPIDPYSEAALAIANRSSGSRASVFFSESLIFENGRLNGQSRG